MLMGQTGARQRIWTRPKPLAPAPVYWRLVMAPAW